MSRFQRHGFTLLETLVAFGLVAMVVATAYVAIAQIASRQARLTQDLEAARLARAILTEYVVTWPMMDRQGALSPRYSWVIAERSLPQQKAAGRTFDLTEVTVSIVRRPAPSYTMRTVMVRESR